MWTVEMKMYRTGDAFQTDYCYSLEEAHASFNKLYNLPANYHNWEWLQLWDHGTTPPTMLREEKGK